MSTEILFRLILGDKVVGYEKHRGGIIYHGVAIDNNLSLIQWRNILNIGVEKIPFAASSFPVHTTPCYIHHTRKDLYTGGEIDGVKVFERDEGKVVVWEEPNSFIVEFKEGAFVAVFEHTECYLSNKLKNIKLTGIEGVTP